MSYKIPLDLKITINEYYIEIWPHSINNLISYLLTPSKTQKLCPQTLKWIYEYKNNLRILISVKGTEITI